MSLSTNSSQAAQVTIDLISEPVDPDRLIDILEALYVQPQARVRLVFVQTQLSVIQKSFDQIIAKHGILTSEFSYRVEVTSANDALAKDQ